MAVTWKSFGQLLQITLASTVILWTVWTSGRHLVARAYASHEDQGADQAQSNFPYDPMMGDGSDAEFPLDATPMVKDPVVQPPVVAADRSTLSDDDQVVGVVAGGQARAYAMRILTDGCEMVNDLLADVPVTVGCGSKVRVLTCDQRGVPLRLAVEGWTRDDLLITCAQQSYALHSPKLPLSDHEFIVTSWGKWRQEHPTTDVFEWYEDPELALPTE